MKRDYGYNISSANYTLFTFVYNETVCIGRPFLLFYFDNLDSNSLIFN